jgi:hypothetical protein
MRYLLVSCLTAGVTLAGTTVATANSNDALDRIAASAQHVRQEAEGVRRLLGDRKTDMQTVSQRVAALESHARSLKDAVDSAEADGVTADQATWERTRAATASLLALLSNKSRLLADADRARQERGLLKAKAEAIAIRASMVEQDVSRLRG